MRYARGIVLLTLPDAHPAVAHVPASNHIEVLSRLALCFVAAIPDISAAFKLEPDSLRIKVGINTGPVIGGVIGRLLPRYRIFGDTVRGRRRVQVTFRRRAGPGFNFFF